MNRRARRSHLPVRNSQSHYPVPLDDAPDLQVLDEAVRNPIDAHRMLSLVDLQLTETPVPEGFDPWLHTPALHLIDACMRGLYRIITESPSFGTDQQLRKRVTTLWPRLIPWSMYFLDQVILEHAGIMISNHEFAKYIDGAVCSCVRFLLRALELDEMKRSLSQLAPRLLSSLTQASMVAVENGIQVAGLLTHAVKKWMDSKDQVTFGDVSRTFSTFPMSRLTGCLTRIISCIQDCPTPVPWALLTYNVMFIQFVGEGDLRLEYLLMKSIPWVCKLITFSRRYIDKHPEDMQLAAKPLILSFGYLVGVLTDGPEWIAQALDNRLIVSLAWFTTRTHTLGPYPQELDQTICTLLNLLTVNTAWRSVLRPMFRSMKHTDLSFLEQRSEESNEVVIEHWGRLEEAFRERWDNRCSYKDEVCENCMNMLNCPGIKNENARFRCSACGINFCSRACQRDKKDTTHHSICAIQRNRKKRGYPEIAVFRDCEFLCWMVRQLLYNEEEYIDELMEGYSQDHGDQSTGIVLLNFTKFPAEVTVVSFDDYKSRVVDREDWWIAELEKAEQRIRTGAEGKLVMMAIHHGKKPLCHFQWLEDFADLRLDVSDVFTYLS
ncbi:hypothetical protein EV421DRAFT_1911051 [Armillaria borealis]|uniref:MYND-type domain-containing protein n=1 Tax=Armillaria borealis TaxID=47425 RepID=A0AA39MFH0_9AGAR|nr:hypothetical protein EV421DRAFT_1911051 [Armillaria borealis]